MSAERIVVSIVGVVLFAFFLAVLVLPHSPT
jgi:hypothetical protein